MDSMCLATRTHHNPSNITGGERELSLDKIKDDQEKMERLARHTNRSGISLFSGVSDDRKGNEDPFLSDESIPAKAFSLVVKFRDIIISKRDPMVIDDFFAQIHAILKD